MNSDARLHLWETYFPALSTSKTIYFLSLSVRTLTVDLEQCENEDMSTYFRTTTGAYKSVSHFKSEIESLRVLKKDLEHKMEEELRTSSQPHLNLFNNSEGCKDKVRDIFYNAIQDLVANFKETIQLEKTAWDLEHVIKIQKQRQSLIQIKGQSSSEEIEGRAQQLRLELKQNLQVKKNVMASIGNSESQRGTLESVLKKIFDFLSENSSRMKAKLNKLNIENIGRLGLTET